MSWWKYTGTGSSMRQWPTWPSRWPLRSGRIWSGRSWLSPLKTLWKKTFSFKNKPITNGTGTHLGGGGSLLCTHFHTYAPEYSIFCGEGKEILGNVAWGENVKRGKWKREGNEKEKKERGNISVQFTANLGQEWTGIRATTQRRDFQVSKGGISK